MQIDKSKAAQGRVREQCFQEENSMSSPITPSQGSRAAQPVWPIAAPRSSAGHRGTGAPFALEATAAPLQATAALNTMPPSPPQEVLEQMAGAARTYETLSSQGRELRFARDEQSGRTRVEVRDRAGNVLKTLTHAQALALAAGTPLE
jgi:hypothetical protein